MNSKKLALAISGILVLLIIGVPDALAQESDEIESEDERIEIEIEIEDGVAKIEVEINNEKTEWRLDTVDRGEILASIAAETGLDEDLISEIWEFKTEDLVRDEIEDDIDEARDEREDVEDEREDGIEIEVKVVDGLAKIEIDIDGEEIEYRLETSNRAEILASIAAETGLDEDLISEIWEFKLKSDIERETKSVRDDLSRFCDLSERDRMRIEERSGEMRQDMRVKIEEFCHLPDKSRADFGVLHNEMMEDFKEEHAMMIEDMQEMHKKLIMEHHERITGGADISDEAKEELTAKFREMHEEIISDFHEKIRSKYEAHREMIAQMREPLDSEEIDEVKTRYEQMREHREKISSESDDTKRKELREEFLSNVVEKHKAWISPRLQTMAGIDADQILCREGMNLVFKESNGAALCLRTSTAEKLIERGIVGSL